MIESKNFKSKQVTVRLYEYKEAIHKYLRIETMYTIINEEVDTARKIFERIAIKCDKKNKLFMLTIKNLEGVDMEFYHIKINEEGVTRRILELSPDTIEFK